MASAPGHPPPDGAAAARPVAGTPLVASMIRPLRTEKQAPCCASRLKEDFPEWAIGMDKRIDAKLASIRIQTPDFSKEFEPIKAEMEKFRSQASEIETLKKANEGMKELIIELQHPGWKDDVKTDQFKKWFMVQPPEVRTLGGSENPLDAIKVLSLYRNKPDASKIVEQRRSRLAQAAEVKGSGASVQPKRFEDMTPEEQWKEMDRQARSRGDVW